MKITVDNNGIGREVAVFYENEKVVAVFRREEDYEVPGYLTYTPSGELVKNWEGEAEVVWKKDWRKGVWNITLTKMYDDSYQIYRTIPQQAKLLSAEEWTVANYACKEVPHIWVLMQSYAEYYHNFKSLER